MTNGIIHTAENVSDSFYCTSDYDNAISVIVWATYKRIQGFKSDMTLFTQTPKSTTSADTTKSPAATQDGINLFMNLCMHVCMYACIYVLMYLCMYVGR